MSRVTTVFRMAILVLAPILAFVACARNPSGWIETEAEPEPSPAEAALLRGRIAGSWSILEYEEDNDLMMTCRNVDISILLADDSIWIGLSTGDVRQIRNESGYDWKSLSQALEEYREMPTFVGPPVRRDIQLAATDLVQYREVLAAMDHAIATGFTDLSFVRPKYLNVDFTQFQQLHQ